MKAGVSGTASSSASASAYSCAALTSAPPPAWHRCASAPRKRRASACARGAPAGPVPAGGEARGASCSGAWPRATRFSLLEERMQAPRVPDPPQHLMPPHGLTPAEGTSDSRTRSAKRQTRGAACAEQAGGGARARAPACPGRPRAGRRARPPRRPGARPAGRRSSGPPRPRRPPWRAARLGQRRVLVSAFG